MRRLLPVLILAAAAGGGAWWWFGPAADAAGGPRLRTAAADRGAIAAVVAATGTVNPSVSVQVGSQLSGQIRDLMADFNTRVTAGQPLARLDTAIVEARRAAALADREAAEAQVAVAGAGAEKAGADLASARAQLASARAAVVGVEAQLRDAEGEARRSGELRARAVGSERDALRAGFAADKARADLLGARADAARAEAGLVAAEAGQRTAQAQVAAAVAAVAQRAAQLRQVEVDLGNATIRAPIDGVVVSRNVDRGQTVAASLQAPILFLIAASLDEMEIWATIDEADIGRVRPGQEATFTVAAFPGETLRGQVREIRLAAQTVQNVVTYTVVLTAPNPGGRLLPGMTATLRVTTDQRAQALRVPNAALRWRPPGTAAEGAAAGAPAERQGGGGGRMLQAVRELPDLTEAQRAELAAAEAELRERASAGATAPGEGRQLQAQAARQRLVARLNAVLTPEQRARLGEQRGRAAESVAGAVWVLDEGAEAPRRVALRTGLTDGSVTEVVEGELAPGARLVVGQERGPGAAVPSGRRLF